MDSKEIMESGLLELYALGDLKGPEFDIVDRAVSSDPSLLEELNKIEDALFLYAQANAIAPGPTVKPFLMARVDYQERLRNGEAPDRVPVLNPDSKIEHFERWLKRDDMQLKPDYKEVQITILSDEPDKMTSIVWLQTGAPPETHETEHEKFLILEGACDLTIGAVIHVLKPGDYWSVPLHVSHHVKVTSRKPCKLILQRVKS